MSQAKVILFADDEPYFVQSLIEELEDQGYKVLQASNGSETIEILSREKVDLLILDVMMPPGERLTDPSGGRWTGIRVAEHVRKEMRLDLPIIFATVVEDQIVHHAISQLEKRVGGESKILVKPILPQELIEAVQSSLGE